MDYKYFFKSSKLLYIELSKYAKIYENLTGGKVDAGSISQLNDAIHYLYSLDEEGSDKKNVEKNTSIIFKAIGCIHQAYLNTYSSLCTFLINDIQNYAVKYDHNIISKIYPNYYTILPETVEIIEHISGYKKLYEPEDYKIEDELFPFIKINEGHITILLKWYKGLKVLTPEFEKIRSEIENDNLKKAKSYKKELVLKWVIPSTFTLITLLVGLYYFLHR